MQITFGDDAFDAYVNLATHIREGYTVALLREGEQPEQGCEIVLGTDVRFISADEDGVKYRLLNEVGDTYDDIESVRPWNEIADIHVY